MIFDNLKTKNLKTYGVVRTDKIEAYEAGRVHHIRLNKEGEEAITQNGELIIAGDIEVDNLDVREGVAVKEGDGAVALIADPVKIYDESSYMSRHENQYYMENGHVARAYKLVPTDVFSVTKEVLENAVALKDFKSAEGEKFAVAGEDGKIKIVDAEVEEGFCAKVVAVEPVGGRYAFAGGAQPQEYVILDVKSN